MNMPQQPYNIMRKAISDYMKENKRFDGRKKLDLRDIEVKLNISNQAEGSVSVKIGKTEILAGIKLGVGTPYPDHEKEGTMMTALELLPMSSADFEYGPPRINSIEVARVIDRGIRESGFIDFEKLCIKEGEKVWNIFIDLATINDDGSLIDAGALAAIIALRIARMPVYDEEKEAIVHGEFTDKGLPLTDKMPITITFHKINDELFVDPTREEESATGGRITLEISQGEKEEMINAMQKGGDATFSIEEIEVALDESKKIFKNLNSLVEEQVKKSKKK